MEYVGPLEISEDATLSIHWSDDHQAAYLGLLKDRGADWIRLDFYYGNMETRNDNGNSEVINWAAFTLDSPARRSLYNFCQVEVVTEIRKVRYVVALLNRRTGWWRTR